MMRRHRHVIPRRVLKAGFSGDLSLRGVALQVAEEAQAQRVLDVHAFHRDEIARNFRRALPEADTSVVHRKSCRVEIVSTEASCKTNAHRPSVNRYSPPASIQRNATQRNATQRNATQRNATQRNATQRNATQRNATQRNATQRNATQRNATQRNATQRNATQRNATQRNATQRNATQRNATQRNATQRNATQRNATQRNATQRNAIQLSSYL